MCLLYDLTLIHDDKSTFCMALSLNHNFIVIAPDDTLTNSICQFIGYKRHETCTNMTDVNISTRCYLQCRDC